MTDSKSQYISENWTGESLQSWLVRKVIVPVMRVKPILADTVRYAKRIESERKTGEAPPPRRVSRRFNVTEFSVAGSRVHSVEPKTGKATKSIIYIHGGAYVSPLMPLQWNIIEGLAARTGARILVPCYPLAPEHDWQPAFSMITQLYQQVLATTPADRVTISGDSAGGGLGMALIHVWREQGLSLPGRLVLFSPWLDLREENEAQAALEGVDPILSRAGLVWAARRWAGQLPLTDPRISPLLGSLDRMPPTLLISGTADILHADAVALASRAHQENIHLHFISGHNMTHAWSVLPVPEGRKVLDAAAAFIG